MATINPLSQAIPVITYTRVIGGQHFLMSVNHNTIYDLIGTPVGTVTDKDIIWFTEKHEPVVLEVHY
jgi:hypothetical protein